jgi:hypothetical protein
VEGSRSWYLTKHDDGTVFGPISFQQLRKWASDAQVSPLDKISIDQTNWVKAPTIPELQMDYLIEVSPGQYYGPTTLGAVKQFIAAGEINDNTRITNCTDNTQTTIRQIPELRPPTEEERPVRTSIRRSLQQRIRELEAALLEERRARENAEHLCAKLEAKLHAMPRPANY